VISRIFFFNYVKKWKILKNIVKSPAMQTNGFMATLGKDSASMCFKECVIKSEEDLAPEVKEKKSFFGLHV